MSAIRAIFNCITEQTNATLPGLGHFEVYRVAAKLDQGRIIPPSKAYHFTSAPDQFDPSYVDALLQEGKCDWEAYRASIEAIKHKLNGNADFQILGLGEFKLLQSDWHFFPSHNNLMRGLPQLELLTLDRRKIKPEPTANHIIPVPSNTDTKATRKRKKRSHSWLLMGLVAALLLQIFYFDAYWDKLSLQRADVLSFLNVFTRGGDAEVPSGIMESTEYVDFEAAAMETPTEAEETKEETPEPVAEETPLPEETPETPTAPETETPKESAQNKSDDQDVDGPAEHTPSSKITQKGLLDADDLIIEIDGYYAILGIFGNTQNALKLKREMDARGHLMALFPIEDNMVQVGAFLSPDPANALKQFEVYKSSFTSAWIDKKKF